MQCALGRRHPKEKSHDLVLQEGERILADLIEQTKKEHTNEDSVLENAWGSQ